MPRRTIAETLRKTGDEEKSPKKKSSADRKRLTIGSATVKKAKIPKITKVFKKKDAPVKKKVWNQFYIHYIFSVHPNPYLCYASSQSIACMIFNLSLV